MWSCAGDKPAGSRLTGGCTAGPPCGASVGAAAPRYRRGPVWGVGGRGWGAAVTPRRPAPRCIAWLAGGAAQLSLCPPCTGTKSGPHPCSVFMEGTASMLLLFPVHVLPDATRGGPPVACALWWLDATPRQAGGPACVEFATEPHGPRVPRGGGTGNGGRAGAPCLSRAPSSFPCPAVPLWGAWHTSPACVYASCGPPEGQGHGSVPGPQARVVRHAVVTGAGWGGG